MKKMAGFSYWFRQILFFYIYLNYLTLANVTDQPTSAPTTPQPCSGCAVGAFYNTYTLSSTGNVIGCTPCDIGYKCDGGCASPIPCPVGTYSNSYGLSSCTSCPVGSYNLFTGKLFASIKRFTAQP
jgi:hypothetical protein